MLLTLSSCLVDVLSREKSTAAYVPGTFVCLLWTGAFPSLLLACHHCLGRFASGLTTTGRTKPATERVYVFLLVSFKSLCTLSFQYDHVSGVLCACEGFTVRPTSVKEEAHEQNAKWQKDGNLHNKSKSLLQWKRREKGLLFFACGKLNHHDTFLHKIHCTSYSLTAHQVACPEHEQ